MTSHSSAPPGQSYGLDDARLIAAPTFRDDRGALGVVQAREIPFAIERLYWLYDVPPDRHRGDHGHRSLQQVLIAMAGSFSVVLHDGVESRTWRLSDRTVGLYIPPMMWRRLEQFSSDGVCLVLASEAYDPADYFPDFDQFVQAARQARQGREELMQFLDVGYTYRALRGELDAAMGRVLESGWYVQGAELAAFEDAFARYCGAQACVGVGNGLDALTLTLRAIGCGPGDEVIVPAHTFIATWLAVSATGATVVPVDADPGSMNIDLAAAVDRVNARTRAIIPVHLYGLPVDVDALRRGLGAGAPFILEDAAQAHGARVRGAPAGSLGDAAGFSFYPAKTLGAFGDGGAVTTRDPELAGAIRRLGNYGSSAKYRHEELGVNSRLDELQAACLSIKLTALDVWNARRAQIAARYLEAFAGIQGLELPAVGPGLESAWHLFVIRVDAPDQLAAALSQRGVPTQRHYPIPPHLSGAYAGEFDPGAFPVTEDICRRCLSLPIGPHLSDAEVDQVCEAVTSCVSR